ncbi:hypothetical protein DFH06DRAFT_1378859, partial [Mycena polygramma]
MDALLVFLGRISDLPEHYVLALPVVFVHLDNSKIPSPAKMDFLFSSPERLASEAEFGPIFRAVLCVHQIAHMILKSVVPTGSYVELWSRLYRWIIFLDIYWQHIPSHLRLFGPSHICAASVAILLTFGDHAGTYIRKNSPGNILPARYRDENSSTEPSIACMLSYHVLQLWGEQLSNRIKVNRDAIKMQQR